MFVKDIRDEVFGDYKKTSMLIATSKCDWKCCIEQNLDISICQNSHTALLPNVFISSGDIYNRYISNFVSDAIVIGGLEPMLQFSEMYELIKYFRERKMDDDIVVYTGYNKDEIERELFLLSKFKNIIVKFGRFVPNQQPHFDEVLGIYLASDNQYAERIS